MNALSHTLKVQKAANFGVDVVGCTLGYGLAALLITTWLVTTPLLRFGVYLGDLGRKYMDGRQ